MRISDRCVNMNNTYLCHYGVKGMKWRFHKGTTTKGVSTILGGARQVINGVDKEGLGIGGSFMDRNRRYAQNRTRHQKGSKPIKSRRQVNSARNSRSGNRGGTRVSAIKGSRTLKAGVQAAMNIFRNAARRLTKGKVTNT